MILALFQLPRIFTERTRTFPGSPLISLSYILKLSLLANS